MFPRLNAWCAVFLLACSTPPPANDTPPPPTEDPQKVAISSFWSWFTAHEAEYRDLSAVAERLDVIGAEIRRIDPGLLAEFTLDPDGTRVLVLTADGIQRLFPIVEATVAAAPPIPGWRIQALRPAWATPDTNLQWKEQTLSFGDFYAAWDAATPANVQIYVPLPAETTEKDAATLGFVALDAVLGEKMTETLGELHFAGGIPPADAKNLFLLAAHLQSDKK